MPKLLTDLRLVDPVLTKLARGYKNNEMVGLTPFPVVSVEKEAGKIPQFGKEAFKLYDTLRAPGAGSNRMLVDPESLISFATDEHDIEKAIDYRAIKEAMFNRENVARKITQDIIAVRHEKNCADLAFGAGNYASSNKVTLSGTDQWSDFTNSNPVGDIETAKAAVRAKIGREPTVMVIGYSVYLQLKIHTKLLAKIKYSQKEVLTLELLEEIFGIKIVVGKSIYATDAGVFTDIWGKFACLAYVPTVATTFEEPSFGYTLRLTGHPWVDKYQESGGKILAVRTTDNFVAKMVGAEAGYLISGAVA